MAEREGMIALVDVAQVYGLARRTVERWVEHGRLNAHKYQRDKRTYVKRADLEREIAKEPPARGRPGGWRKGKE